MLVLYYIFINWATTKSRGPAGEKTIDKPAPPVYTGRTIQGALAHAG